MSGGASQRVSESAGERVSESAGERITDYELRITDYALLSAPYFLLPTSYSLLLAEYTYDQGPNGIGRRTAMTDTTGSAQWGYDAQGRAIRETRVVAGAGTFVTAQGYDAAGRVTASALPTGETVHNTYNLRGLPETVAGLDTYLTGATYNALGQPRQQTWGNGRQTVYSYDPLSQRLESLQVGELLNLSYTYDQIGNLLTLTDAGNGGQVQTFAYDARDRLTRAQTNAAGQGQYSEAYGYDLMGNIITRTYGSKTVVYTYGRNYGLPRPADSVTHTAMLHAIYLPFLSRNEAPAFQQPFAVVATSAGFRANYDRNGNMLTRVEISGTQTITYTQEWTVENRLSVVTNTVTGDVTRFVYDGDGTRVLREDPSGLTVNVGAIEVEISGTQRLTTTYYFAGGQRIAMRKSGEITYLHGDHLGSASLATDASGAKVSDMRYTPFGETRYGNAPTDRRFTGQREESGIGLYDFNARFYSASVGRFVSADSMVPQADNSQDLNRYSYVGNNPLKYVDPTGHLACSDPHVAPGDCSDEGAELVRYGINLQGDWTKKQREALRTAAYQIGKRFAEVIGGTPWGAFQQVYGGIITLTFCNDSCADGLAWANSRHSILFDGMYSDTDTAARHVVHEFGHLFDRAVCAANGCAWDGKGSARSDLRGKLGTCDNSLYCLGRIGHTAPYGKFWGFAGGFEKWQFALTGMASGSGEIFADMFLGWTYDTWEESLRGDKRRAYMNWEMSYYLRTHFDN